VKIETGGSPARRGDSSCSGAVSARTERGSLP
jgi:hypothetical protein